MSTETHHLEMQSVADDQGFIEGTAFHKNHKANLMALCEACHQQAHHNDDISVLTVDTPVSVKASVNPRKKVVRKKTNKGYSVFVEDSD
jgi:alpha-D-ribose 1-methylphosphonate 5-triphosphate synthase subunit PhnG